MEAEQLGRVRRKISDTGPSRTHERKASNPGGKAKSKIGAGVRNLRTRAARAGSGSFSSPATPGQSPHGSNIQSPVQSKRDDDPDGDAILAKYLGAALTVTAPLTARGLPSDGGVEVLGGTQPSAGGPAVMNGGITSPGRPIVPSPPQVLASPRVAIAISSGKFFALVMYIMSDCRF